MYDRIPGISNSGTPKSVTGNIIICIPSDYITLV